MVEDREAGRRREIDGWIRLAGEFTNLGGLGSPELGKMKVEVGGREAIGTGGFGRFTFSLSSSSLFSPGLLNERAHYFVFGLFRFNSKLDI